LNRNEPKMDGDGGERTRAFAKIGNLMLSTNSVLHAEIGVFIPVPNTIIIKLIFITSLALVECIAYH
jgi:hypothetical protein